MASDLPAKIGPYDGMKHEPRDHQRRALREAKLKKGHCFWVDPGGGKTFICLTEASYLWQTGQIDGMIVIAPNGVQEQWCTEQAPEHLTIPFTAMHNQRTDHQLKNGLFKQSWKQKLPIFAINYEALRTPKGRKQIDRMLELHPRCYLAIDESQRIKSHKAARSEAAIAIARRCAYVRCLSGTPILKGVEDLFCQYDAAIPGVTGFSGFWAFAHYYCIVQRPAGRNVDPRAREIVGYRNEEVLKARTAPYASVIKATEFMERPDPDFIRRPTPMNREQATLYKAMEKNLVIQLASGSITAKNALVQMNKLLQLAAGFVYDEDGQWHQVSTNKTDDVTELASQLDEPVIIFSPFIPLSTMIETSLTEAGMGDRIYKVDTLEDWKKDPTGILLGNQTSNLGTGRNLQHSSATIYAANNFSSEARWQSLKRTDRMGQPNHCRYWDLVTPGTRDAVALRSLDDKEEIADANIDGLLEFMQRQA